MADQIYKWTDKQGNVHYSDRPHPNINNKEISITPGPTDQQVDEALKIRKRLNQTGHELAEQSKMREQEREKQTEQQRKQQAELEQQKWLEEQYQQDKQGSSWYYGGTQIYTGPRPRHPVANRALSGRPATMPSPSSSTSPP